MGICWSCHVTQREASHCQSPPIMSSHVLNFCIVSHITDIVSNKYMGG